MSVLMNIFKFISDDKENKSKDVEWMISVWHDGGSRAGIKYEEDGPPIFYSSSLDAFEEEIAFLKADGEKIKRVEHEDDLEREISFD